MYGAILGDIIGSPFEFDRGDKTKNFNLFSEGCGFTDDSVMTIAVGEALLAVGPEAAVKEIEDAVASNMQDWGKRYPHAGYGGSFRHWLKENNPMPYGSYGNGSAMRVSAAGWLYDSIERTREVARATANVTHNHPEGIKGAEATAIIIPVNLKELYYSKFYNKVDWTHSFLIYGYDKDNELYQVFDSVQNVGGKNLYEFVVQKKEMEKLYESFCENIYADGIYYIESNLVDCKKNWYEIFKNGVNEFINYRTEKAYVEIEFIENLCKKENISTAETRKLFEINNYKKVFLKELIHLINMCTIQEEDMEKLSNLCSNIYKSWLEADSQIVYCLKKNKRQEIKKILEKPLYFENQLVHALKYITEENISHDSEECRFLFVNNSDQIINKLDNGNILFCFNQGKTYNNWFDDLAPRFVLKQQDLCQFKLSTEFEIIEYDSCINFCFGVYIKDDSGNSYLFGNNSMNYVCFEHTGVDSGITESYVNENKFKIEIYCNGKELRLRYIESSNISIVFNKKVKLYGNVFQIGITCKTWGALGKFEGIANNILFQEG